jgi:hypothetical protein
MEKKQSEASKAPFDRLPQAGFDFFEGWIAETAFAGDLHAIRQVAPEGFANDLFGFAIAVARRQVDQVDPNSYYGVDSRDAFVERCFTPHHADAPPASAPRPAKAYRSCSAARMPSPGYRSQYAAGLPLEII